MGLSQDNPQLKAEVKSGKQKSLFSRNEILLQYLDPSRWSLKGRFFYLSGALLLLGNIVLIFFFYFTQQNNVRQLAADRLSMLGVLLENEVEQQQMALSGQAMALATIPEVHESMAAGDLERLKRVVLPYLDRIRSATGISSHHFQFRLTDGRPFFLTDTSALADGGAAAEPRETGQSFVESHYRGIAPGRFGLDLRASAPILDGQRHVGDLAALSSLPEILYSLRLPRENGVTVLTHNLVAPGGTGWTVIKQFGTESLTAEEAVRVAEGRISTLGNQYFAFVPFVEAQGRLLGGLVLSYDAALQRQIMWSKTSQFILFYSAGAIMVWIFLFINVARIERFLARLKKILISSHSNYFSERFESDHVHCLDILRCKNEECPVYQNPSLVCYLETGSEAIAPKWRDTCTYLNKYEKCNNCPVYSMRKGDEVTEMRNVVNTMMRLWGDFLSRVGHLLAYVLPSQEWAEQAPSLDEISDRLEQMAKLTFFSHDIQGVIDKEEVYQQLSHVFEKYFDMTRFVLFEVDHDRHQTLIALDTLDNEPLCKNTVLINPNDCRAKRVAENVMSFHNPKLCPHFNANLDKDVRCCLPIVMAGQVGAIFSFLASKHDWEKVRIQVPAVLKYLNETAPVLSSLRLLNITKEQTLRDPLTLCNNRRFLDEFIVKYEPLVVREQKRTGFLMVDMDYFKQVNDKYGHQAGDVVLQQIGKILLESIRKSDLLIRYGGEEFLILLQNVQHTPLEQIAEKIRSAVEQHKFALPDGVQIDKTVSIGVSEHPADADVFYKAIKFADVALYEAKRRGRNQVVRFTPEMWTEENY